ncbi:hypothetical protein B0T20DRAFT_344876 [Sordaria brevicollis]|uniref:DUF7587 domain-containing protein n=1 Tax=Sordaria brevicollis TaxID=83679 RepID=A0AAE0UEQ4_SORBR|nr:hypothetical protein B0T20DRAFT_344876 [Sordaria brevicollis]
MARRRGRPWTYYSERYSDIPRRLYFVEHAGSQSYEDDDGDFTAAGAWGTGRRGRGYLQDSICDHVNWYYRGTTCFISAFSNYHHAMNWARQRDGPVFLHTIDTCRVEEDRPPIFYAPHFTDNCWSSSEYLFLDYIPNNAIIRTRRVY